MKEKIYLSSPHMGGTEQNYVQDAFDTNWIAPLGPNVNAFELALESYLSQESHVAALSSGTAAIHLSLIMLGVGPGDEVLCQSMTFSASANPIVYQGATPIFIDSEPDTWNLSPHYLEEAINARIALGKKPKAIIAVHLYGMPYKVDEVAAIAKKYDIPVIEDSAEALGSSYNGQKCGTFGHFSILSFNGNKIITTSGGGALATRDISNKNQALFLATQARDDAPHYQHSHIGYNYRMSNICAGIGRGQMEVLDAHVALRREMNLFYKDLFSNFSEIKVFKEYNNNLFSNHWLSCITFNKPDKNNNPNALRESLMAENIESRPLWKPMHLQPVFKNSPYYGNTTSETLFNTGLCLPSGSNLDQGARDRIANAILKYFKR
ncbi:DegT/DnrJ/EryC1/StrS family aminotransferase [Aequorivita marisscotiae]|uniref:Aminotransferase class I/II-fold pyridoxal phosphate-dependent enzyme n=1 Tax=Aequorivita marisscotiae TaxID=3040348 RepID=A0ABY8KWQ9_9FLAO|nr:aminotransferase class I/II-fold pyridoxal phosphate-dependent enzyme [Aequorivita sp. Ant34-E75]WGF92172.1 aminotransferase class I/II-fold pyridoxal phosphate-dependent enzyme [Aequorivita sp. Ant34-E75]